ncbi:MAG: hypothetical protein ACI4J0_02430 [Huintestinicola sp.]|uniref:hypothetical protein n=1 Tax=Huintestinicola sp. TaxID=2981661 RepID=UPI003F0C73E0
MMNKKLAAFIIAVFLLFSCGFTVFSLPALSFIDFLDLLSSIDPSLYDEFTEQEWSTMSADERVNQINYVISDQNGSSFISESSDFINEPSLSYQLYNFLTQIYGNDGHAYNIFAKQYLEENGLADFGMGYYSGGSGGHSSGSFGDGTVADTLNDEFLDYLQDNPLSSDPNVFYYSFENGYHATLYLKQDSNLGGAWNWCLKLVSPEGNIIFNDFDIQYTWRCRKGWIWDYDITKPSLALSRFYFQDGYLYTYKLDGSVMEQVDLRDYLLSPCSLVSDYPSAVGVDENGNEIQLNVNSDGVIYEGNTYNYNDDNSVTINGDTYQITVNPSTVNDDYYQQFLGDTINNYYNYYNTTSTPFDDTDILTSLKSIFSSLERVRSDCYSQLRYIYNTVHDGLNSIRSLISTWGNKILKAINSLGGSSDLSDEDLLDYHKKLEQAVNSRFGVVISLRELVDKALSSYKNSSLSSINFKVKGFSYSIDFSTWFNDNNLQTIRLLMAAFIYVSYAFNTFRRIPSYIYNGGDR